MHNDVFGFEERLWLRDIFLAFFLPLLDFFFFFFMHFRMFHAKITISQIYLLNATKLAFVKFFSRGRGDLFASVCLTMQWHTILSNFLFQKIFLFLNFSPKIILPPTFSFIYSFWFTWFWALLGFWWNSLFFTPLFMHIFSLQPSHPCSSGRSKV